LSSQPFHLSSTFIEHFTFLSAAYARPGSLPDLSRPEQIPYTAALVLAGLRLLNGLMLCDRWGMAPRGRFLNVYQAGKLTVVSFVSAELLDQVVVSECREEIAELINENHCEVLAFDLTGVKLVPSGMLGMLASLGRLGVEVFVFNPSEEIREVLEITRLDTVLQVRDVDI
jgi:anti-sigma B factor antagonist